MTKYSVPEMSCGHCTAAIEKEIKSADKAAEIACDLDDRSVAVQSTLGSAAILAAIKDAGYEASVA
jgi:copper chaperone